MIDRFSIKDFKFIQKNASGTFLLEIKDFHLSKGEIVFLMGNSGSGKSTFFNLLTGIKDSELSNMTRNDFSSIEFVMHESKLLPWHTLKKNVDVINKIGINQITENKLLSICVALGLPNQILKLKTWQLSLGMRQRFEIALALSNTPNLVIFDEALSGIDNNNKKNVCKVIYNLIKKNNTSFIGTAHQVSDILRLAERVVLIENGKLGKSITISKPVSERLEMDINDLYSLPDAQLILNLGS